MNNSDSAFIEKDNDLSTIKFLEWPIDADDDEQFRAGYPYTPDEEKEIDGETFDTPDEEKEINDESNTNIQADVQPISPSSSPKKEIVDINTKPSKVQNYGQRFTKVTKEKGDCNNHDQNKYHQIQADIDDTYCGANLSSVHKSNTSLIDSG
ncbi:unnamed protein product [Adineta steineri]|uniref:Uncharacterized protein n=1 Tax=Adineta steineri TaxID=433720 RepID=A0A815BFM4_9BILA|nr:unnamed protein product [Adineta steineri]CAF1269516.1 unnamed protein product [Adineta steineri]